VPAFGCSPDQSMHRRFCKNQSAHHARTLEHENKRSECAVRMADEMDTAEFQLGNERSEVVGLRKDGMIRCDERIGVWIAIAPAVRHHMELSRKRGELVVPRPVVSQAAVNKYQSLSRSAFDPVQLDPVCANPDARTHCLHS